MDIIRLCQGIAVQVESLIAYKMNTVILGGKLGREASQFSVILVWGYPRG